MRNGWDSSDSREGGNCRPLMLRVVDREMMVDLYVLPSMFCLLWRMENLSKSVYIVPGVTWSPFSLHLDLSFWLFLFRMQRPRSRKKPCTGCWFGTYQRPPHAGGWSPRTVWGDPREGERVQAMGAVARRSCRRALFWKLGWCCLQSLFVIQRGKQNFAEIG